MNKDVPGPAGMAVMAAFALSVVALLLFLWVSFGGPIPLKPQGYRFEAAFPEAALLVEEADVRLAGVNVGKVKGKELAQGGRRTIAEVELDDRFAPIPRDTRAILRQKTLLGETYIELTPGSKESGDLPDGGTLRRSSVEATVEIDEIFSTFDEETRRHFRSWLHEAGIVAAEDFARDFNGALGNLPEFVEEGTELLSPLDAQELALKRLVRNTGRTFDAISERDGELRGLIVNGDRTFDALASRDDSLAETFEVFPTFLRETRATMRRLEGFSRNTNPLVNDLKGPADDLAPTLRDLGDLSPDLEKLFRDIDPLVDAARDGVPAAERFIEGAEPLLGSVHAFMPELNPVLSYLSFSQEQIAQFITAGGAALAGNGDGGYMNENSLVEHYLPQIALIDERSFQRRTALPPFDRGNSYVAPNAYSRAVPLGTVESFTCAPTGQGEVRDPPEEPPAPPCFLAPPLLFQNEKYPRLQRGRAPVEPAPTGREGTEPAVPRDDR